MWIVKLKDGTVLNTKCNNVGSWYTCYDFNTIKTITEDIVSKHPWWKFNKKDIITKKTKAKKICLYLISKDEVKIIKWKEIKA